ncbi:hypothetical protein VTJ83DRAFT_4480 [Remersonia thermophila]|uniref:Uncharacterized protein n=1 Tax=Remersonia thermophila TaxID=72144 RepID=A0ABR4DA12_9PEZI
MESCQRSYIIHSTYGTDRRQGIAAHPTLELSARRGYGVLHSPQDIVRRPRSEVASRPAQQLDVVWAAVRRETETSRGNGNSRTP